MAKLYDLRTGDVINDGEGPPETPTDPWQTGIGRVVVELSSPSRPGERTPLRREDARVLLAHLLSSRRASYWDDSACCRVRDQILRRMTVPKPTNDEFVQRKIDLLRGQELKANERASRTWLEDPLDGFDRAIRHAYADRFEFLNETRLAYFRAVFVSCLVEANSPSVQPEDPRIRVSTVRSDR